MSRPRKRRSSDPAAVLAELRRVAKEMVTEEDLADFLGGGWDQEHATWYAIERHRARLVLEWEREHRMPLRTPTPEPVLVEGVNLVRTRAELRPDHG